MTDTQLDTQYCTHSAVIYAEDPPGSKSFRIQAIRCKRTIGQRRRWIASVPRQMAQKCRGECGRFEPRGEYNVDACKRLMARALEPWLPDADHFIYDYLGLDREDVVRRRTR